MSVNAVPLMSLEQAQKLVVHLQNDEFEQEPIPYSEIEISQVLRGTTASTEDIKDSWILKTVQPGTTGATQPFTQYNLIVQNPKYFEPAAGNTSVNTFFFTFSVQEYEADLVTKIGDPILKWPRTCPHTFPRAYP